MTSAPTSANKPATATTVKILERALAQQRAAYHALPNPDFKSRQHDLKQLERFVRDHMEEIVQAISADYGHRSRHETLMTDVMPVLGTIADALKQLRGWMKPQKRAVDRVVFGMASNTVIPQPLGVIGVIVPWNFPLNLTLVPMVAIFAAGNRAMVKMSENSRQLTRLLMEKMPAYLPPEKLQFFEETGGVGPAFSNLKFDHLLFTGSSATGRSVMANAAGNLCPVTLELGGSSPAIIADDFSLRTAAERILYVKYLNAGQICTTVNHVFVPREKVAEFARLAQEIVPQRYASLDSPDYTSIIDDKAFKRITSALQDAKKRRAKVIQLIPGAPWDATTRKIAPHIVIGAPANSALMQQEIFGPVLPIVPYDDVNEVIDRINAGPRPLALYPFSHNKAWVSHLLDHVMSGGVSVNDALLHVGQHDLPFGGVGESGMGHYHGLEGFQNFSKLRPVFSQARVSAVKLLFPPYGLVADKMLAFLLR
jgi:coniferyl-aldehyde dehydrogenase